MPEHSLMAVAPKAATVWWWIHESPARALQRPRLGMFLCCEDDRAECGRRFRPCDAKADGLLSGSECYKPRWEYHRNLRRLRCPELPVLRRGARDSLRWQRRH